MFATVATVLYPLKTRDAHHKLCIKNVLCSMINTVYKTQTAEVLPRSPLFYVNAGSHVKNVSKVLPKR